MLYEVITIAHVPLHPQGQRVHADQRQVRLERRLGGAEVDMDLAPELVEEGKISLALLGEIEIRVLLFRPGIV